MTHREVELLAIGAGPANLSLAVALEELAPDLADDTVIVERHDDIGWQRGMLLPWSLSQVSFLKDLVTLRNPRSKFSFVNYLHSVGRLDDFVNLGSFTPYRLEISDYLRWVAGSLSRVRIEYGRRCTSITPVTGPSGEVDRWLVGFADGTDLTCRDLVIGAGRDANVPEPFADLPRQRVVHSTEFLGRRDEFARDGEHRFAVVGGAQSAAEMLWATHQHFPRATCTMIMRSIGLNAYETSKFTNELFYASFVDKFHEAAPAARDQLLREMHRTNYSGLAPGLLESLYRQMYQDRLTGTERIDMRTMTDVTRARLERTPDGDEVVLTLRDRRGGSMEELRCDAVLLGTGFVRGMPRTVRDLAARLGVTVPTVDRHYRLRLPENVTAGCHLQGVNETTHGIADSLLSVLAIRSAEIVSDILARRRASRPLATAVAPQ